jgi:subtilase family serine protease
MSLFSSHRAGRSGPRSSLAPRKPSGFRALRVESLESREMLSLSLPGFAVPDHVAAVAVGGVAPLSTAGPSGMTPTQVRHAYGFDKISFGGIVGDGSGTTIAIVDAYDDPKIANDLHQFDVKFGLPDPTFTKVNQTGGTAYPTADRGWSTEIALDVEWAHAVAPGANILLVEANDNSMSSLMTAVD